MARALWKGSISFGLVDIPVSLHGGEETEDLHFTLLDRRDMSPVRYERVSVKSGKPVPWADIVKGHALSKGEYVVVTDEELRNANVEATQTVDIFAFVDASDIPPEYFEKPYFLAPTKRGRKGYVLLREALTKSGKVGLAKVVVRTRQQLAALIPREGVLMLEILRWSHELRDVQKELDIPAGRAKTLGVSPSEVAMAERLIEGMEAKWEPEKYKDEYRDDVMAMIEKKAKSGKRTAVAEGPTRARESRGGDVLDFKALLQRSLKEKIGKAASRASSGSRRVSKSTTASARRRARKTA